MEADENADRRVLAAKRARLGEPHVAPIVALCDEIAARRRLGPGAVPYPDPHHGGVHARALFVLSHPGAAAPQTRFLSLGNQDSMSKLALSECRRTSIRVETVAHWNAVPFPPAGTRLSASEKREGAAWLSRLVALLPELEVVALLGRPACDAWPTVFPRTRGLAVVEGPSPGPPGINVGDARARLAAAFERVADVLARAS